ncbi:MAG: hypothetical protein KAS32_21805 [Candidatus Peribacteraceae bacterium]|nr:hypothetical protein [Candidatus Peribacteraceae bacterium]
MAYGTSAGVTLLIGKEDTITYTSANITAAIAMSDTFVDDINSDASDANKTLASNLIAANILRYGRGNLQMKGLSTDGGLEGRPAKSRDMSDLVPKEAIRLLNNARSSSFTTHTPDSFGN